MSKIPDLYYTILRQDTSVNTGGLIFTELDLNKNYLGTYEEATKIATNILSKSGNTSMTLAIVAVMKTLKQEVVTSVKLSTTLNGGLKID